jgi:excisionase family DNA binding protein
MESRLTNRLANTVDQTSERTNTSRGTLYKEIRAGRLRIVKLGRKTLILEEALQDWLRGLEQKTAR